MSITPKIPENEFVDVVCAGRCGVETRHDVLTEVNRREGNEHVDWWSTHQIICCRGCSTTSFRVTSGDSESYDITDDGLEYEQSQTLYPARKAESRGLGDEIWYLPASIASIYKETREAMLATMPVLTGIGLRALLEAICNEQLLTGTLYHKINEFVGKGVLTQARATTLHRIRDVGNDAAHETKEHTAKQLAVLMGITEHLMHELYILPPKTDEAFGKPKTPRLPLLPPSGSTP